MRPIVLTISSKPSPQIGEAIRYGINYAAILPRASTNASCHVDGGMASPWHGDTTATHQERDIAHQIVAAARSRATRCEYQNVASSSDAKSMATRAHGVPQRKATVPSWRRTTCTRCREPVWYDGTKGFVMCKLCLRFPSRVQECCICCEHGVAVTHIVHDAGRTMHICRPCVITHISLTLDSGATFVRCPGGCTHTLNDDDVGRVSSDLLRRLRSNRFVVQQKHLLDLFDESPSLLQWASDGNAQVCPRCSSLVERSGGCRHMTCKCGCEFCYHCGGSYPCHNGSCSNDSQNGPRTVLRVDYQGLLERRKKRRMAFLQGSRCADSIVSLLPPDTLKHIVQLVES